MRGMKPTSTIAIALSIALGTTLVASDWPQWRGPHGSGISDEKNLPERWSATENVVWKAPLPGRGHSSPTVVGDRVFITTAEEDRELQAVLCFDRRTGNQLWRTDVHRGLLTYRGRKKPAYSAYKRG